MTIFNYYAKKLPDGRTELMRFADGRPIPRPYQREDTPQAEGKNLFTKWLNKGGIEVSRSNYQSNLAKAQYIQYQANGEPRLIPCHYTYEELHGRANIPQATLAIMFPNANVAHLPAGVSLQAKLSEAAKDKRHLFLYDGDNSLDGIHKIGSQDLAIARVLGTAENEIIVVEPHDFEAEYPLQLAAYNARQKEGSEKSATAASTATAAATATSPAPSSNPDQKSKLEDRALLEHRAITVLDASNTAAKDLDRDTNTTAVAPDAKAAKFGPAPSAVMSFQHSPAAAAAANTPFVAANPSNVPTTATPTAAAAATTETPTDTAAPEMHVVLKLKGSKPASS